ncbi:MAG: hypothetical protein ACOYXA_00075 [Bacteroidota bacterium]
MDSLVKLNRNQLYHKILYFYFQEYIFRIPQAEREKFIGTHFWAKVRHMLLALLLSRRRARTYPALEKQIKGKRWVFIFGKNNYEATRFLADAGFVFVTESPRSFKHDHEIFLLPVRRRLTDFFRFIPTYLYLRKHEPRAPQVFDAVFAAQGWLEAFQRIVKTFRPEAIVFSNDHSMVPRALFYAAKSAGIPTIYVQHASISPYMPPLEFDLSLLEGNDALEKYRAKGIDGRVLLIGVPKMDHFIQRKRTIPAPFIRTVGIAFNTVDSHEKIRTLIDFLHKGSARLKFVIRPHPKDYRPLPLPTSSFFSYSDSKSESPADFILRCDLIIAGDSSIHLEARLLNVDSIYYNLSESQSTYDLYGYLQTGLVKEFSDAGQILAYFEGYRPEEVEHFFPVIQRYHAGFATEVEGASSLTAIQAIDRFLREVINSA